MKNKKVWCEKRETKEKGFFEKIRNSCFKASFEILDITCVFKKHKRYKYVLYYNYIKNTII
ncbi:MAG: hypothetical protein ISS23_03560 [Nanoarchaeota archaeon]|nr:hypothetical protein [Nanoarchaeota archaeon]